ncbi:TPA: hypothetical protein DDY56_01930 [Candidatus Uhrbacteria bacterium]|nr:hypothetical protein [Candidatus Uhrbacteria bacterium]HAN06293.1 hypothetical protein [Candidatus Uhrbacteria bacterium]HAP65474.1 hypothetical protein [Candidatus Uhrbacteria bacterium]HBA51923.1 hypothetical protein [Candidatus Uhrbacteria bacterium]HBC39847.1 hypothetical protein [Candidatus Uhrbacteria bacterium]
MEFHWAGRHEDNRISGSLGVAVLLLVLLVALATLGLDSLLGAAGGLRAEGARAGRIDRCALGVEVLDLPEQIVGLLVEILQLLVSDLEELRVVAGRVAEIVDLLADLDQRGPLDRDLLVEAGQLGVERLAALLPDPLARAHPTLALLGRAGGVGVDELHLHLGCEVRPRTRGLGEVLLAVDLEDRGLEGGLQSHPVGGQLVATLCAEAEALLTAHDRRHPVPVGQSTRALAELGCVGVDDAAGLARRLVLAAEVHALTVHDRLVDVEDGGEDQLLGRPARGRGLDILGHRGLLLVVVLHLLDLVEFVGRHLEADLCPPRLVQSLAEGQARQGIAQVHLGQGEAQRGQTPGADVVGVHHPHHRLRGACPSAPAPAEVHDHRTTLVLAVVVPVRSVLDGQHEGGHALARGLDRLEQTLDVVIAFLGAGLADRLAVNGLLDHLESAHLVGVLLEGQGDHDEALAFGDQLPAGRALGHLGPQATTGLAQAIGTDQVTAGFLATAVSGGDALAVLVCDAGQGHDRLVGSHDKLRFLFFCEGCRDCSRPVSPGLD